MFSVVLFPPLVREIVKSMGYDLDCAYYRREGNTGRMRVAELTSGVGALVLGVGLGALLSERLSGLGLSLLVLGAVTHAWGMFDKHRMDKGNGPADVWWGPVFYWTCWALLGLGAAAVVGRLLGML